MANHDQSSCPFCGSPEISIVGVSYQGGRSRQHVRCPNCGAQGPAGTDSDQALDLWGSRIPTPPPEPAGPRPCPYCESLEHTELACPKVKAFEFHQGGTVVSRVEFKTAADYPLLVTGNYLSATGIHSNPYTIDATSSDDVPTS